MRTEQTRRAPGGALTPVAAAVQHTAVPSRDDGRGGQRHLPVAPPRSPRTDTPPEVQARVREARDADPTRGRLRAVTRLLAEWSAIRLDVVCQRLGVSEAEALARLRELRVVVYRRGGETWVQGAKARWTVSEKPEARGG